MNGVNAYFFAQVTTWAFFMFANRREEDQTIMNKLFICDAANKILPAIVLILSVLFFRWRFNSQQLQKVFARENIIVVLLGIFFFYIITYVTYLVLTCYWVKLPKGSMQSCRFNLSSWYFVLFYIAANIVTLIFFIYVSVVFSRPITGYWKEFLLSYR